MPQRKGGAQRSRSQPASTKPEPTPPWLKAQAERLDAASQVFSGLSAATADDVYPVLYTKSPGDAIDFAQKIMEQADGQTQGQSSQPGQGASSSQPSGEWVRQAQRTGDEVKTHHDVNVMQNRYGEDSPTLFNPARHTVVIAGRPVQVTVDGHLVMSLQPCARHHSFENMFAFLSSLRVALLASRVCAWPHDMEIFSFRCAPSHLQTVYILIILLLQ